MQLSGSPDIQGGSRHSRLTPVACIARGVQPSAKGARVVVCMAQARATPMAATSVFSAGPKSTAPILSMPSSSLEAVGSVAANWVQKGASTFKGLFQDYAGLLPGRWTAIDRRDVVTDGERIRRLEAMIAKAPMESRRNKEASATVIQGMQHTHNNLTRNLQAERRARVELNLQLAELGAWGSPVSNSKFHPVELVPVWERARMERELAQLRQEVAGLRATHSS